MLQFKFLDTKYKISKLLIIFLIVFEMCLSRKLAIADEGKFPNVAKQYRNAKFQLYFSPHGGCQDEIIEILDKAKKTIDVAMYTFTSKELCESLVKARGRGVAVRVYLDDSMKGGQYSQAEPLMNAGIPVKFDNHSGLMHNKFAVIDNDILIDGSYNWTKRAEDQNDENIIIFQDEESSNTFTDKFNEYWSRQQ